LAREGVERHLIVGVEAVEEVRRDGRGCRLVVHDVVLALESNEPVKVAAEKVGVGELKAEGKLDGGRAVLENGGARRIGLAPCV
jgi:hypothetical protein